MSKLSNLYSAAVTQCAHLNYLIVVSFVIRAFQKCEIIMWYYVDAPRNLQLTPNQSTYQPGDRIQCSAEGNPSPSYHWTDLVSGTVVQGAVLDISEDMVNQCHAFQCTASNQYNSKSSSLHFMVTIGGSRGIHIFLAHCHYFYIDLSDKLSRRQ